MSTDHPPCDACVRACGRVCGRGEGGSALVTDEGQRPTCKTSRHRSPNTTPMAAYVPYHPWRHARCWPSARQGGPMTEHREREREACRAGARRRAVPLSARAPARCVACKAQSERVASEAGRQHGPQGVRRGGLCLGTERERAPTPARQKNRQTESCWGYGREDPGSCLLLPCLVKRYDCWIGCQIATCKSRRRRGGGKWEGGVSGADV